MMIYVDLFAKDFDGIIKRIPYLNELGITLPKEVGNFPAGSMFWYRPTNIDSLLSQDWNSVNFPPEEGQIDGTVMHAIERILGAFNAQQQTIL